MALIVKNYKLDSELIVPSMYIKIDNISGNKNGCSIVLKFFVSREVSDNEGVPVYQQTSYFTPSVEDGSDNFIRQGYEFLKTLPQFVEAIDV